MNIKQRLWSGIVALCFTAVAHATTPTENCNPYAPVDKKVVFVNGVQVEDEAAAQASMHRMEEILCTSANHAAIKKNFSFDLVYNPIGWTTVPNDSKDGTLLQDVMEVFVLKAGEENYGNDMRSLQIKDAAPRSIDPYAYRDAAQRIYTMSQNLTSGITSLEQTPSVVTDFATVCNVYGYCSVVTTGSRPLNENDMLPTKNTINTLANKIASGQVILVAHSEGNLIAHLAYAYAVDSDVNRKDNVRVVNIANTAQFSLNDFDLTHDSDTVITALRSMPSLKSWSRNTTRYPGWNTHDFDVDPESELV